MTNTRDIVGFTPGIETCTRTRLLNDDFGSFYNLYNAGGAVKQSGAFSLPRNHKYPLSDNILPNVINVPRWEPDRLSLSTDKARIYAFDIDSSRLRSVISTNGRNVPVMATYLEQ